MSDSFMQNGATERIEIGPFVNSSNVEVTGDSANITLWIRRNSDGFTWNGSAFASGVHSVSMTETDSTVLPGVYHYDFSPGAAIDTFVSIYAKTSTSTVSNPKWKGTLQIGGTQVSANLTATAEAHAVDAIWDEILSGHLTAGTTGGALNSGGSGGATPAEIWAYAIGSSTASALLQAAASGDANAISDAVKTIIDALDDDSSPCGSPSFTPHLLPNVYAGHKGDSCILPVFRNYSRISDAELLGAISLSIRFRNMDTGAAFTITSGVSVGANGTIIYVTAVGDSIFETAGHWQYQASGITSPGNGSLPFKSQIQKTNVLPVVA